MTATLRAVFLSVAVVGLLVACGVKASQETADPGPVPTLPPPPTADTVTPAPPTTEATTTTTTALPRLDAADFSPCELLPDELGGQPLDTGSFSRYLPSEQPSVDLCVGWTEDDSSSIDVGYVAYGSLTLPELLEEVTTVSALDVGDDSGAGRDGTYWIAAASDADRQLLVRVYDPEESFDLDEIEAMTSDAWDQLPDGPPSGGTVQPDECESVDQDLVEAVSGKTVLARGGDVEGALSCGYLGEDGDAVLITVIQNPGAVDNVRTLGERDGWRRLGAGKLAYVSETNERFYVAIDDDTLVYLEMAAVDPPAAGSPIDEDRQALFDDVLVVAAFL